MVFASPGYLQTIKAMNEAGKNIGVMKRSLRSASPSWPIP